MGARAFAGTVAPINTARALAIVLNSDKPASQPTALFVSLAGVEPYVVAADYGSLYCLDSTKDFLKVVEAPPALGGKWMPTGVLYHRATKKLYVANYLGNDIIEGTVDCIKGSFQTLARISTADTVSPEDVVVSPDGNALFSANYDGNNVTAFRRDAGRWVPDWTQRVAQAHGIALRGEYLYATSLFERALVKLDAKTGRIVGKSGRSGTEAWNTEFLWPTGLLELRGALFVTDAHTGFVCSFDEITLQTKVCFGGNGPGANRLHMPYGIAEWSYRGERAILVASAFASRISEVVLDAQFDGPAATASVRRDWYWTGGAPLSADYLRERPASANRVVAIPGNARSSVCLMPLWLPGMTCEYATLVSESRRKVLAFPTARSIVEPPGQIYFIESFAGHGASDTYFLSPQNLEVDDLRLIDGVPYMLPQLLTALGGFVDGEQIVAPTASIAKSSLIAAADAMLGALRSARDQNGIIPVAAAAKILGSRTSGAERVRTALHGVDEEDRFVHAYEAYDGDMDAAVYLRKLAMQLAQLELQRKDVLIDVLVFPCMLTNAKCEEEIWKVLAAENRPRGSAQ